MPIFDYAYHQRCIAADDFSIVAASIAPIRFASRAYGDVEALTLSPSPSRPPAPPSSPQRSLKCSRSRSSSPADSETSEQPRKRFRLHFRFRLRLRQPQRTGLKLRLRNSAAARPNIILRLRNPAAAAAASPPQHPPLKLWLFRLPATTNWCQATNNEHKAQWFRETFACGSWVQRAQVLEPAMERFLWCLVVMRVEEDESWQEGLPGWQEELRPEDALGEREGEYGECGGVDSRQGGIVREFGR